MSEDQPSNNRIQQFIRHMVQSSAYQCGNDPSFAPDKLTSNLQSPLRNQKIAFLGSSVTYGFAAKGKSFVDYLVAKDGIRATKSAVSGTTLAGTDQNGYLARLRRDFSRSQDYQLFVCQLSTNDNRHGKPLGTRSPMNQRANFNLNTTIGAIEEICRYVDTDLRCPLAFYTCLQDDPQGLYQELIQELKALQDKWHFAIIDLFNNQTLLRQTADDPDAMFDDVHPTQKGYLNIWLPVFEKELTRILAK